MRASGLKLAAVLSLLGCTEHHPIHPIDTIVRAEGAWVVDPSQASRLGALSSARQRLEIRLTSESWPEGAYFKSGVPYAAGTANWSGSVCPVSLQIGSPQRKGAGYIWVAYDGRAGEALPSDGANPDGFCVEVMIAASTSEVDDADPAADWLFVDFYDAPL